MVLRHLTTGVYWITFLYFINYTIDILIQIEKECKKRSFLGLRVVSAILSVFSVITACVESSDVGCFKQC